MMRVLLILFFSIEAFVEGGQNGGYYECESDIDNDPCVFTRTDSAPFTTAIPHDIDRGIANDGYRIVKNENGEDLPISAMPWTNGDYLGTTCDPIYSDIYAYTLAFEIVAPLRDVIMFEPESITPEKWTEMTKVFQDCQVKAEDVQSGDMTVYGTDSIYKIVTMATDSPKYGQPRGGLHHSILQYLEEGAIDLVCLMCPSFSMDGGHDRCIDARIAAGIDSDLPTRSTCWEAGFEELYGFIPAIEETTTLERIESCEDEDHTDTDEGDAGEGPPDDSTTGGGPPDDSTTGGGPPDDSTTGGGPPDDSTTGGGPPDDSTTGGGPPDDSTTGGGPPDDSTTGGGPPDDSTTENKKGGSSTGGSSKGGSSTGGSSKGGSRSSPDGGIDTKSVKEMFLRKVGGR